mmetsp:Transcript_13728/g.23461  ORF Transcript_13728/g.23461 Transcript_13728/m.23461 type:complete len:245 (-) Transcript_13728:630-1364(-)
MQGDLQLLGRRHEMRLLSEVGQGEVSLRGSEWKDPSREPAWSRSSRGATRGNSVAVQVHTSRQPFVFRDRWRNPAFRVAAKVQDLRLELGQRLCLPRDREGTTLGSGQDQAARGRASPAARHVGAAAGAAGHRSEHRLVLPPRCGGRGQGARGRGERAQRRHDRAVSLYERAPCQRDAAPGRRVLLSAGLCAGREEVQLCQPHSHLQEGGRGLGRPGHAAVGGGGGLQEARLHCRGPHAHTPAG